MFGSILPKKKRIVRKSKKMLLVNTFFFSETVPQIMQLSVFWTVFKAVCRNGNCVIVQYMNFGYLYAISNEYS